MSSPARSTVTPASGAAAASVATPRPATADGASSPPTTRGAMNATTRSASSWSKTEPWTWAPPSTRTLMRSSSARSLSTSPSGTRPFASGAKASTLAPAASSIRRAGAGAPEVVATTHLPSAPITRAAGGSESRLSTTTRSGWRATLPASRADSSGSSASTVPTPTRTASCRCRSRWPSWRAASPVIQRDSPAAVAMRPSKDEANLAVTKGSPAVTQRMYCSLSSRAASASTPTVTSMPARRRLSRPPPLTRGLGSGMAVTQREIPAATTASVQGGVRPWWQQGSRETTRVAPRAASPASRRAVTSAWGPPAGAVRPRPRISPSRTTTAPTMGLGLVA